jgi:hypothetical protein
MFGALSKKALGKEDKKEEKKVVWLLIGLFFPLCSLVPDGSCRSLSFVSVSPFFAPCLCLSCPLKTCSFLSLPFWLRFSSHSSHNMSRRRTRSFPPRSSQFPPLPLPQRCLRGHLARMPALAPYRLHLPLVVVRLRHRHRRRTYEMASVEFSSRFLIRVLIFLPWLLFVLTSVLLFSVGLSATPLIVEQKQHSSDSSGKEDASKTLSKVCIATRHIAFFVSSLLLFCLSCTAAFDFSLPRTEPVRHER